MVAHKDAKGNIVLLPVEDEPSSEQDITDPDRSHSGAAPAESGSDQVIVSCINDCIMTPDMICFIRAWSDQGFFCRISNVAILIAIFISFSHLVSLQVA